ncbi:MAG TPA: lipopolysaccharide assembly protein LapA domain-containing protein [Sphingomicrobium sp.]|jgi:lipopolysaccharide assembly protein A|nr:lipopolysaccharide assembly protein LapA domain-containing protein [Sphingomicrobium sp.]
MQFLKTLFWVVIAALVVFFGTHNWTDVTLQLWGDILVDVKLPVLLAFLFLAGFLPTWLILRARLWTLQRRLEPLERQRATASPPPTPRASNEHDPVI